MKKDVYGLSKPQEAIWLTEQYFKNTNINRIISIADFSGKIDNIDFELLKKSINHVVKSNDGFQIRIILDNGIPKQYISDYEELDIPVVEINSVSEFINQDTDRQNIFNLVGGPLYEFTLFKIKGTHTGRLAC